MSASRRNAEPHSRASSPSFSCSQAGKATLGKNPGRPSRLQTSFRAPRAAPRDQRMLSPPCRALGQGLGRTGRVPHAAQGQGEPTRDREATPPAQPRFGARWPSGIL